MFSHQDYYLKNKETILAKVKTYYRVNRAACLRRVKACRRRSAEKYAITRARWAAAHPWDKHLRNARARCEVPTTSKFKHYGGRGIRCLLTTAEVEQLWTRDGAAAMSQPSLSRKDPDGNYVFSNCRFAEFTESRINRRYDRLNATCRRCVAAFHGNGKLDICQDCRRTKRAKNAEYSEPVRFVRAAALRRGLAVEPIFGKLGNVAATMLKINGQIVTVSHSNSVNEYAGREYNHWHASSRKADVRCLVRRMGRKRHEVFFYPSSMKLGNIFIPTTFSSGERGRKPVTNWRELRSAWHLFDNVSS